MKDERREERRKARSSIGVMSYNRLVLCSVKKIQEAIRMQDCNIL
jgi:hypothetical protein